MVKRTVLLNLAVEIGYRLQVSGAEIYRVEEAVLRVFQAYGVEKGQVFAIPNCLIVSVIDNDGRPITRLRRIPSHGTDVSRMERVYDFCRSTCQDTPAVEEALARLESLDERHPTYPLWAQLAGYFLGAGAFTPFWGGSLADALAGGLCGVVIGICLFLTGQLHVNQFVKTVLAAFLSALLANILVWAGLGDNAKFVIIGALMTLVPGLVFTNFMRDIMAGDTVAGLIKLVEALLIAGAIAVGIFLAMAVGQGGL